MFPTQIASRWITVATLLCLSSGALAGPRLSADQYRQQKAVYQQRGDKQAGLYKANGNFKQHVWSESNRMRGAAAELRARAAEASDPAQRTALWNRAKQLDARADALNAQLRKPATPTPSGEPNALPAPAKPAGLLPAPAERKALPAPAKPAGLLTAGEPSKSSAPAFKPADRQAAAARYDSARLRFEAARANRELAKAQGNDAARQASNLEMARAKVTMLQSQAKGLRTKAEQASAAGNIDAANQYLDKADRLAQAAKKINAAVARIQKGSAATPTATPAAAAAKAPAAATPPAATDTENPFEARNANSYKQRLSDDSARQGAKLRDVKKLVGEGDLEGSLGVLARMEEKARTGNFAQRAVGSFQAARARRAIRNEAGRVMRDGAQSYAENVEGSWMQLRLRQAERIDQAHALVASGQANAAEAKAALSAVLRQEAGQMPRRTQSAVIQAERVLTTLARAEQQHKAGPVRAIVAKLSSLVLGSASSTLKGGVADMEKKAKQLAKQGPEGALAAHLMMAHAKTVARNARDLGLNPAKIEKKSQRIHNTAVRNLSRTIEQARQNDPETLALAYNALEGLRLDSNDPAMAKRIEKDLVNYHRDIKQASLGALDQLSRYAEKLSKMRQPEAQAEAAKINTAALAVRDVMLSNGVAIPAGLSNRIEKTDAKVNGRTKFGYRFHHADGVLGKTGVVLGQAAKILGKTVLFPVKVATLPFKLAKRIIKGNGMMEAGEVDRKMRGIQSYATSFMPEQLQRQMENAPADEGEQVAAAPVASQAGYTVPPPAILNNMPGR